MIVIRARALGFCFGVRDAIHAAFQLPNPTETIVHGELVHNQTVLRRLAERGFAMEKEIDRPPVPPTPNVLITAHGISDRARQRLQEAGKGIVDTTCPLVRRAHAAALRLQAEDRFVIVVGKRGHVEVEGLTGDLIRFAVVESSEEVDSYEVARLGVVYQTTTPPGLASDVLAEIYRRNPGKDIRSISTICQPTRDRQAAVIELLGKVEALVVVGGHNSNNTRQLVALARHHGLRCFHVQDADELKDVDFAGIRTVGLTAGTSTPDEAIDEVEKRLLSMEGAVSPPTTVAEATSAGR